MHTCIPPVSNLQVTDIPEHHRLNKWAGKCFLLFSLKNKNFSLIAGPLDRAFASAQKSPTPPRRSLHALKMLYFSERGEKKADF